MEDLIHLMSQKVRTQFSKYIFNKIGSPSLKKMLVKGAFKTSRLWQIKTKKITCLTALNIMFYMPLKMLGGYNTASSVWGIGAARKSSAEGCNRSM